MKTLLISLILLFITFTHRCYGQDFSLTISPPTMQTTILHGQSLNKNISIKNNTEYNQSFKVNVQDFIVNNSSGIPEFLERNRNSNFSLKNWITVYPQTIDILPHQNRSITYTISIPKNAKNGGYYAAIIFEPLASSFNNTAVTTQIASLISVFVPGKIKEYAEFSINNFGYVHESIPVDVSYTITNLGDTDIQPQGIISIKNIFGKEIEKQSIQQINIFPHSRRIYLHTTNKYLLGYYHTSFNITYGIKNELKINKDIYFWVLPWKMLLFILLSTLSILTIILFLLRKSVSNKPRMM